jgi:hypothetical protein
VAVVAYAVTGEGTGPRAARQPVALASLGIDRIAGSGEYLDVALSYASDGTAVVAWIRLTATGSQVEAVQRRVGADRWSAPTPLPSPSASVADLGLVTGSGGDVALAWRADGGPIVAWYAARWRPGTGWSAATTIARLPVDAVPQLVALPAGALLAVWSDGPRLRYATLPAASSLWSPPGAAASLPPGTDAHDLQVGAGGDGLVTATWIVRRGAVGSSVMAATFRRRWSRPVLVAAAGSAGGLDGLVEAVDRTGRATIVWRDLAARRRLRSATHAPGSPWVLAAGPSGVDVTDAYRGSLRGDAAGAVTGGWLIGSAVAVARRDAGGAWSPLTDLASGGAGPADERLGLEPSFAIAPGGSSAVVWAERDGLRGTVIRLRTAAAGAAWTGAASLHVGHRRRTPLVAIGPDGHAVTVVWQDNAGNEFGPFVDARTIAIESLRLRVP